MARRSGPLLRMNSRGSLTIPKEVRKGLDETTIFEAVRREDGVIELRPRTVVDAAQRWFWSRRWQEMEGEAEADIKAGRVKRYADLDEFFNGLDRCTGE